MQWATPLTARAQQSRWTGVPNETIMFLVEDKIGAMLEGVSDATERNAAAQIQLDLQKKLARSMQCTAWAMYNTTR